MVSCSSCTSSSEAVISDEPRPSQYERWKEMRHFPIQQDTAPFHRFGDIVVKRNGMSEGAYISKNIDGYRYTEHYPNVLNKSRANPTKSLEVLFFDSTRTQVLKTLNFRELNPYMARFDNAKWGYPSFEYYEAPLESDEGEYDNAVPDTMLTFYNGGHMYKTGYVHVIYSCVGVKDNKMLTWESTILIFDSQGNLSGSVTENNQTGIAIASQDGDILSYGYGNYNENPYDDAPDGEVRIRDLKTGGLVYVTQGEPGIRVMMGPVFELGNWIGIGHTEYRNDNQQTRVVELIDLDNRLSYKKTVPNDEYMKLRGELVGWKDILEYFKIKPKSF